MRSPYVRVGAIVAVVVMVIGVSFFFASGGAFGAAVPTRTPTPIRGQPVPANAKPVASHLDPTPIATHDLDPTVAANDKGTIDVQHPDGTIERYVMDPSRAQAFKASVKPPDRIVGIGPSVSLMEGGVPPYHPTPNPTPTKVP